jgi:PAS domain-containing protein
MIEKLGDTQPRANLAGSNALTTVIQSPLAPEILRTLTEMAPIGIVIAGRSGLVTYANEAARRFVRNDSPHLDRPLTHTLLLGELIRDEIVEEESPDGRRRWLSFSASPVRAADGGIEAAIITITDVTDSRHVMAWRPAIESLQSL